jgi:hypothetical protein
VWNPQVFSSMSSDGNDFRLPIEVLRTLIMLLREFPRVSQSF